MSEEILSDGRFAHISNDPRYLKLPRKERRVKIDKRFHGMFHDKQFKVKYSLDKRGRPINKTSTDDLKRFYHLEDSDDESGDDSDKSGLKSNKNVPNVGNNNENTHRDKENDYSDIETLHDKTKDYPNKNCNFFENMTFPARKILKLNKDSSAGEYDTWDSSLPDDGVDLARGEGNVTTDSESDELDYESEGDDFDHHWDEIDDSVPKVTDATNRLAVCNMDWDRIKSSDLYFLFDSFKLPTGHIKSVSIYPSEYGLKKMQIEDRYGPVELKTEEDERNDDSSERDDSDDEDERINREKIRAYQMKRLRYYYAVIVCDSVTTANSLYEECDGREFEASCTRLDLRFIPDDMTFDHEPSSVCTQRPDPDSYNPNIFITKALGQSKVELTWDETDRSRVKFMERNFSKEELENLDFETYLASGDSDDADAPRADEYVSNANHQDLGEVEDNNEEKSEDDRIQKYKDLLARITEAETEKTKDDISMEVTWEPGMLEKTEELVKKKKQSEDTTWERYLQKRKEKKKMKRQKSREKQSEGNMDDGLNEAKMAAHSDSDLDSPRSLTSERHRTTKMRKALKKKTKALTMTEQEKLDKEKRELSLLMDDDDQKSHFKLSDLLTDDQRKKTKRKKELAQNEDTFTIQVEDPRFSALFTSPAYNIDPSAPEFKRTKAMNNIMEEKIKRRDMSSSKPIGRDEVGNLIETVKKKSEKFTNKFKQKAKLRKTSADCSR